MNGAVVAGEVANERGNEIVAQTVRVVHVLYVKDGVGTLAVQRRDELASVQLRVGERWHLEVDAQHVLCTRHDCARDRRRERATEDVVHFDLDLRAGGRDAQLHVIAPAPAAGASDSACPAREFGVDDR